MLVTKADGTREAFRPEKLERSLRAAGASQSVIKRIVAHVETELTDGITTSEIYNHAFDLLKRHERHPTAARYSLKRAVMDLGPTGFPFEKLIAEIFSAQGFAAQTNVTMRGKCVEHEIDFIAERKDALVVGEAKFHNQLGLRTDLKVVLYVDARFRDIAESGFDGRCAPGKRCEPWLVTNTRFTNNARTYASCSGHLHLVGWDYPKNANLQTLIERTGLHPITCLTTLSQGEKQRLFDTGTVLCRSVQDNEVLLQRIGVVGSRASEVLEEASLLCVPERGTAAAR